MEKDLKKIYHELLVLYFDVDDLLIDKEHIKKELNRIIKLIEESE